MKKITPYGDNLKAQLRAAALDRVHRFMLAGGTIRGAILHGTRMVNEMRANHELGILETLVLGHAYLAGGLMTANLKGNDRVQLAIDCSGPIGGLVVEANAFGEVRGHLKRIPIPLEKPMESFDLSPLFGAGFLEVTRHLESSKQPFTGRVILNYGSIARDLAYYYVTSEQIPTAFHLSIKFDSNGDVTGAGGLYLQVLPEATEETVIELEKMAEAVPSLGDAFTEARPAEAVVEEIFASQNPDILDSYRVEFMCHCSEDRIRSMLAMLPPDDLVDMRDNGPFPIEIRCHHCNSSYAFEKDEIAAVYDSRYSSN